MAFYDPRLGPRSTIDQHVPGMLPAMPLARPGMDMLPGMGQRGPTGIAALLQRPGLRDALFATGTSMLAQTNAPGGTLGALGQALPMGMMAFQQGQQEAEIDALLESAPPEMRRLLKALPAQARVAALLGLMKPKEPVKLGKDERLVDPSTQEELIGVVPEPVKAPTATVERAGIRVTDVPLAQAVQVLDSLPEVPPEEMTPYQRAQIQLDRDRLALDRDKAAKEGNEPVDPSTLRKEYDSNAIVKQTTALAQSYQTILSASKDPSAAGDLALIFNYMKMLDPGSSVREGEFANAQNAAGIPERIRAQFNNVKKGERLTEQTRADFIDRATKIARGQRQMLQGVAQRYAGFAKTAGADPAAVVFDPFSMIAQPKPGAPDPLGLRK
jgi:hypothetical protein